jgi:protein-disulfide isomerase
MNLAIPVGPDDHALGPEDAAVTLVEYGDYQCSDCGRAHLVIHSIRARFGPRLRFVFRNMPLVHAHRYAELAARAAEAAGVQGRFWPMHDLLFEHQRQLGPELVFELASLLELDLQQFEQDVNDRRLIDRIEQDVESGIRSGVEGTPTFYINGRRHDDASDEETLAEVLERRLPA